MGGVDQVQPRQRHDDRDAGLAPIQDIGDPTMDFAHFAVRMGAASPYVERPAGMALGQSERRMDHGFARIGLQNMRGPRREERVQRVRVRIGHRYQHRGPRRGDYRPQCLRRTEPGIAFTPRIDQGDARLAGQKGADQHIARRMLAVARRHRPDRPAATDDRFVQHRRMTERKRKDRRSPAVGVKTEFILRHGRTLSTATGITNGNPSCSRPAMGLPS